MNPGLSLFSVHTKELLSGNISLQARIASVAEQ